MNRLEALAVGKACHARLHSFSTLRQREPLIALGSHRERGFLISESVASIIIIIIIIIMNNFMCHFSMHHRAHGPLHSTKRSNYTNKTTVSHGGK